MASMGIAAATSVDEAFDAIRVGTGATGEALKDLQNDFKAVAGNVPDNIGLVGQVLADLNTRTGQTGEGLQNLTEQILDMSRITGTDAVANVGLATRAFGDWDVAVADQADTLDMFFRASQATGIGVDQLMGKVVQFGAPMRQMGFELEETAALFGKFEQEGVNAELVMGSLRIALGKFARAGREPKEALQETIEEIQRLGPGAEATALAMETFGARAGSDMAAAILEGRFELGELFDTVSNGTETIAQATEDTEEFSDKLSGFFNTATVALGEFAMPLAGLGNAIPGLTRLLPMLGGGIGSLIGHFGGATAAVGALRGAMTLLLGPIGLVIAAVGAFAVAFESDFLGMKTRFNKDMEDIGRGIDRFAMNFGDMGDATEAAANKVGADVGELRDRVAKHMEETGVSFGIATRAVEREMGGIGDALNDNLEAWDGYNAGVAQRTATMVHNVETGLIEGAAAVGIAADLALRDPVFAALLESEENANRSGYQVVLEYAKGLLTPQNDVQIAIDAALQVVEDEMSRTEEYAYLSGQMVILEEARGLASAEGKTASVMAIDAAMEAIRERMDVLPGQAYNSGYGVVTSYAQGMWAGVWQISAAANEIASRISNTTRIESEPPDRNSPLYGITKWGGNIVKTIAEGIYGELGTGAAAAQALAGALVPGLSMPVAGMAGANGVPFSGAGNVNNYYLTVAGKEPVVSTAQEIIHEMDRLGSFGRG
jgi:hypothetical protein